MRLLGALKQFSDHEGPVLYVPDAYSGIVQRLKSDQNRFKFVLGRLVFFQQLLPFIVPMLLSSLQKLVFLLHLATLCDQGINFFAKGLKSVFAHLLAILIAGKDLVNLCQDLH